MRILHLNWSKLRVSLIIKIVSFISCVIGLSWSKLRVARFYFLTQWIKFREVSRFIFLSLSNTVGTSERAELRSIMLLHFQCDSHWKPLKGLTRHAEVITFLLDSSANVACYPTSHLFWQVFCTRVMLMSSWGCVWFLQLKISLCKQTLKVYKTQKKKVLDENLHRRLKIFRVLHTSHQVIGTFYSFILIENIHVCLSLRVWFVGGVCNAIDWPRHSGPSKQALS